MKAAMQYQNKTPEELVRQYKKRLRAKQGLLILIFLLYVIVGIRGIWWEDDGMPDVLLKLFILIVITFPINIWISWDFMSLNMILNQECDPVTYVQVMRLLEKVHKRKRSAGYTVKLQKVVSAVCLADVDIACNELKNARTHLEYAIREGGTLYVVEDARCMLAELAQKERVEGTGHGDGKYAGLLERAKNANFDCACGYDPDGQMEDDFGTNSLLDCIYLCREMKYRDVMGSLVDEWKKTITEWSDSNRRVLIDFNTFLERNAENEKLYQKQLAEALSAEKAVQEILFPVIKI